MTNYSIGLPEKLRGKLEQLECIGLTFNECNYINDIIGSAMSTVSTQINEETSQIRKIMKISKIQNSYSILQPVTCSVTYNMRTEDYNHYSIDNFDNKTLQLVSINPVNSIYIMNNS